MLSFLLFVCVFVCFFVTSTHHKSQVPKYWTGFNNCLFLIFSCHNLLLVRKGQGLWRNERNEWKKQQTKNSWLRQTMTNLTGPWRFPMTWFQETPWLMDKDNIYSTLTSQMVCPQPSRVFPRSSQIRHMKCYGTSKVPHINIYQRHEILHQHTIKSTRKLPKDRKKNTHTHTHTNIILGSWTKILPTKTSALEV